MNDNAPNQKLSSNSKLQCASRAENASKAKPAPRNRSDFESGPYAGVRLQPLMCVDTYEAFWRTANWKYA
jgi:hypothetical protein